MKSAFFEILIIRYTVPPLFSENYTVPSPADLQDFGYKIGINLFIAGMLFFQLFINEKARLFFSF